MPGKRDSAPVPIAEWGAPIQGVWRTLPIHKLPPDAIYNNLNTVLRDGQVTARSGLAALATPILTEGRVTGGLAYIPVGTDVVTPLFATNTHIFKRDGLVKVDITGEVGQTKAEYTHESVNNDNDLQFVANVAGELGNGIHIELEDPEEEASTEVVVVTHTATASYSHNGPENHDDVQFSAVQPGYTGNNLTITLVDPGEETATESVEVVALNVIVTLRSVSEVLSTALQVKAAIDGDVDAAALMTVIVEDDGSDPVTELTRTHLTGGVTLLSVTLRSVDSVLSTAHQVRVAINNSESAEALVDVFEIEGDGTGVVEPLTETALAGGTFSTVLTGEDRHLNRFTQLVIGDPDDPENTERVFVYHTNGVDPARKWNGVTNTFTAVECDPPFFTDVTTAFDRIVGIIPPYKVRWGEQLSLSQWPELNARNISDTPDPVVAIRNLGTMNLIVYKEKSIWAGGARGGSSAQAFSFEIRGFFDGPANPAALSEVDNVHYYMTKRGRIGAYDGRTHRWLGDGIWPLVKTNLDTSKANLITSFYDPRNHEIVFNYPMTTDEIPCQGIAILTLPRAQHGVSNFGCWFGQWTQPVSWGGDIFGGGVNNIAVFVASEGDEEFTLLTPATGDLTIPFNCSFQSGLVPTPNSDIMRPELETFVTRGAQLGTLTVNIRSAYILDSAAGTQSANQTITLSTTEPVEKKAFSATRGRFFGYEYRWTTGSTVEWKGALLRGRKVEE
jgi:hypothetical protein